MGSTGDSIEAGNANWTFGGDVAKTFDEHVSKSVPLYGVGHDLIAKLSDFFLSPGSVCYEVGCSTAALTEKLYERNKGKDGLRIIGLDVEESMISVAHDRCDGLPGVSVVQADALEFEFEPCDLIVSYYVMQFVKPKNRQVLFDRLYEALNWGGGLLLFEKVRAPDARFQDMMSAVYVDYKLDQGYDEVEIVNKTRSLKGILEPFSTQGNLDLLERAGFSDVMTVMKYVSFEGFLAIK